MEEQYELLYYAVSTVWQGRMEEEENWESDRQGVTQCVVVALKRRMEGSAAEGGY